jgi:hypothetical protein
VYTHTVGSCSNATEVRTLSLTDHKPIQRCECTPQTISDSDDEGYDHHTDSLLSRLKLDYDVDYDATVKGVSVVVRTHTCWMLMVPGHRGPRACAPLTLP